MVDKIEVKSLGLRTKDQDRKSGLDLQVAEFLADLGLDSKEVALYLALVGKAPTSALSLARITKIPRTNVYRILESLKARGLVSEVVDEKRKLAKAADLSRLEFLLNQQREKVKLLENLFPQVRNLLKQRIKRQQPGTEVLFYRGKEGLTQQVWNELKARGEIVGYTLLAFEDIIGKKLAQKYREERMIRNVTTREILADDDRYLTSETLKYTRQSNLFKNYDWRYLPRGKINVTHNLIIYDDVVSIYNWYEGEIFGVEIHNQAIATMQRQIFELLWTQSLPAEEVLRLTR